MKKGILMMALTFTIALSYGQQGSWDLNLTDKQIIAQMECTVDGTVVEDYQLRGGARKTYQGRDFTGCSIKRYPSGKIYRTAQYRGSNKFGKWVWYWEDGDIKDVKYY